VTFRKSSYPCINSLDLILHGALARSSFHATPLPCSTLSGCQAVSVPILQSAGFHSLCLCRKGVLSEDRFDALYNN
jgi:hypothetical protein